MEDCTPDAAPEGKQGDLHTSNRPVRALCKVQERCARPRSHHAADLSQRYPEIRRVSQRVTAGNKIHRRIVERKRRHIGLSKDDVFYPSVRKPRQSSAKHLGIEICACDVCVGVSLSERRSDIPSPAGHV